METILVGEYPWNYEPSTIFAISTGNDGHQKEFIARLPTSLRSDFYSISGNVPNHNFVSINGLTTCLQLHVLCFVVVSNMVVVVVVVVETFSCPCSNNGNNQEETKQIDHEHSDDGTVGSRWH
jgi:hypothetical protein